MDRRAFRSHGCVSEERGASPENRERNDRGGAGRLEACYAGRYQLGNLGGQWQE